MTSPRHRSQLLLGRSRQGWPRKPGRSGHRERAKNMARVALRAIKDLDWVRYCAIAPPSTGQRHAEHENGLQVCHRRSVHHGLWLEDGGCRSSYSAAAPGRSSLLSIGMAETFVRAVEWDLTPPR